MQHVTMKPGCFMDFCNLIRKTNYFSVFLVQTCNKILKTTENDATLDYEKFDNAKIII